MSIPLSSLFSNPLVWKKYTIIERGYSKLTVIEVPYSFSVLLLLAVVLAGVYVYRRPRKTPPIGGR